MKELLKECLKWLAKNPKLILEIIKFISEHLAKGCTREQTINTTVARYNLPIDKVAKMVDLIIEKLDKSKKAF